MNDFRILKESTFNMKGGKLYLMMLREEGRFGVEVVNRSETLGRQFGDDRPCAESMFDKLEEKLSKIQMLSEAETTIRGMLSLKPNEFKFVLSSDDVVLSQAEVGRLMIKHKPTSVKTKYNQLFDAKKKGSITIYVFFGKKPIGRFAGVRFGKNFKFEKL